MFGSSGGGLMRGYGYGGGMMGGYGGYGGPGNFAGGLGWLGIVGMILHFLVYVGIFFLVFYFVRHWLASRDRHHQLQNSALQILNERYARGEVSTEDYQRMKKDLA
ncbi:MAG: SHOCT domain-containing protein [Peptococcaceae bacterium]|nr:SHOCT domain-containing protein [Peptococcaceae bacterium]